MNQLQFTPAQWLSRITERLAAAGIESAEAEAVQLLEAASGLSRSEQLLQDTPLNTEAAARLEDMVRRREQREPLQYITGTAGFYGLELNADARALIPRFETEVLVELALQKIKGLSSPLVIDVATGSGAIALAIASERPDALVTGSDISERALDLAAENSARTSTPIELIEADLLDGMEELAREADLIVSNPPYLPEGDRQTVSPEVKRDPPLALFAGEDGLDVFRLLLKQAGRLLKPGAWLLLELDPRNIHAAAELAAGFSEVQIEKDLTGRERFLLLGNG